MEERAGYSTCDRNFAPTACGKPRRGLPGNFTERSVHSDQNDQISSRIGYPTMTLIENPILVPQTWVLSLSLFISLSLSLCEIGRKILWELALVCRR